MHEHNINKRNAVALLNRRGCFFQRSWILRINHDWNSQRMDGLSHFDVRQASDLIQHLSDGTTVFIQNCDDAGNHSCDQAECFRNTRCGHTADK